MENANIMIVEDEVITAMNLKAELNSMGYEGCKFVTTGAAAIKNVEQAKPDIVLMDIILHGEINGIEAAKEIHSRHNIPIIFITGCEDEGTRKLAEAADPVGYFVKPVNKEVLRQAIEKAWQSLKKDSE